MNKKRMAEDFIEFYESPAPMTQDEFDERVKFMKYAQPDFVGELTVGILAPRRLQRSQEMPIDSLQGRWNEIQSNTANKELFEKLKHCLGHGYFDR